MNRISIREVPDCYEKGGTRRHWVAAPRVHQGVCWVVLACHQRDLGWEPPVCHQGGSGCLFLGATREMLARSHQVPPGRSWQGAPGRSSCPTAGCGAHVLLHSTQLRVTAGAGGRAASGRATNGCLPHSSGCQPWPLPSQCPVEPSCLSLSLVRPCTLCGQSGGREPPLSPSWAPMGTSRCLLPWQHQAERAQG